MARASKASAASKKTAAKKASAKKSSTGKEASASSKAEPKAAPKKAAAKDATPKAASKAPAKKAAASSRKKSAFDSKFLERMRKLLLVERDTYERQAKQLRAEADSLVMDLDPGDVQFDEESGEGDTIAVERGRDLALAAKALEMIEEIDHALSKFDEGTYGICEVSGEPIPQERLEAIPWAREKVEFKVGGFGRR
ncbi:MAG TPA: TraR/DksA C4-type zinc finger protein [Acidimicrobiales bacterium]|nr:TraR/DksA C4-type zinc finger protein [Acidimicrobiales bacterium]